MAKIDNATINRWRSMCSNLLAETDRTLYDVKTGKDAWWIGHVTGIVREAYEKADIHDAHIQTALEKIFPNAVFRDKKIY